MDRVHRLVFEWDIGPENSFPSQLLLLTCAQFRADATIPRAITDIRKWLEQHLAEYRQQTAALASEFENMVNKKTIHSRTLFPGTRKS